MDQHIFFADSDDVPFALSRPVCKKVLLLNSYNYSLQWTASITKGVEDVLLASDDPVKFFVEFMDTKNHVSPEYYQNLAERYRIKYGKVRFDAIVTSDDNAVNFVLDHRKDIFGDAPVIFCGVNNYNLSDRPDFTNMSGILEAPDVAGSLNAALLLQPNLRTIYCVIDETTSGKSLRADAERIVNLFKDRVRLVWLQGLSMGELEYTLAELPEDSAVLLMTFTRDKLGQTFSFNEALSRMNRVCQQPIYSLFGFYLGNGIVGGMLTSGKYQGSAAGKMALQVLNGTRADDIPLVTGSTNRYMFDWKELDRFKMDISDLPVNSIIINKPLSFYQQNALGVWSIAGIILFLLSIIVLLLVNIRARKNAEKNLEELNIYQETLIEQRTEELVQRSKDLEMANYELKKLDELKTAVLNTVSHDLRTPLTAVLGFCKIIDRDFKRFFLPLCEETEELKAKGARIRDNLTIIETEGERLTRLINNFLDLSKIESGRISWNDVAVDPARLIDQAIPVLEGYFVQPGVTLTVDIGDNLPKVVVDPDRLFQVLSNLVGNAAKFTREGKVILTAGTTEGGWLMVKISDTGIGIAADEVEYIFDNFYQVQRDNSVYEVARGSGMGLAISQRIIHHYGGQITAKSTFGKGSSFTFTLPSAG